MYSQILKYICSKDDYFKDFIILPFKFVVINRDSLSPLVWTDENNLTSTDKVDVLGNAYPYWKKLYDQFQWHVKNNAYKYSYESYKREGERVLNSLKCI